MKSSVLLLLVCCAPSAEPRWAYGEGAPAIERAREHSTKEDARAAQAGLPKLYEARFPAGDVEVRASGSSRRSGPRAASSFERAAPIFARS